MLSPGAAKAFDKLNPPVQRQLADALHAYAISGLGDVKAMAGSLTARLRSGDFRVIFDENRETIVVLALGDRKEIYR